MLKHLQRTCGEVWSETADCEEYISSLRHPDIRYHVTKSRGRTHTSILDTIRPPTSLSQETEIMGFTKSRKNGHKNDSKLHCLPNPVLAQIGSSHLSRFDGLAIGCLCEEVKDRVLPSSAALYVCTTVAVGRSVWT